MVLAGPSARVPNGKRIGAEKAGVIVGERGFHPGRHPDAHECAAHLRDRRHRRGQADARAQGHARRPCGRPKVAAGEQLADAALAKTAFDARVIPSVAYTDPEVAWVGVTEDEAKAQGLKIKKGLFPWKRVRPRKIANGRDEGFTKLLFDEATHAIVGRAASSARTPGDMIGEIALCHRDGGRRGRHRQDDPPASDARRKHRSRGRKRSRAACTDLPPVKR